MLDGNLDPNHNHLFRIIQSNTGKETFVKPDRHRHDEVLGQYIVSLLLKIDVNEWEYSSYFSSNRLSEKDAKRLIAKKPYLGDMQTVFKAKGVTPDTRRMALEELEKEGIEHTGKWLGKDRLIVKKWDTIDDCVDDIGTKEGKSFFDYYIKDGGKMDFDYWPEDVSWFKDELLDYVHKEESELFKKMGDYLAKEHPDQLADLFSDEDEEESSYDPSDRHDVEKLLDESDDGDAMQALRSAGEAGSRGGAEGEASKIFQAEVEKNPYLFFTTGEKAFKNKKPRWSKKLQEWDGEVIYAVPLGEVIQAVETDSYNLGHDGWAEALGDGALNPETPYNGMTDFDWEYAKERFVEALQELLE